jgi:hypothetical protein
MNNSPSPADSMEVLFNIAYALMDTHPDRPALAQALLRRSQTAAPSAAAFLQRLANRIDSTSTPSGPQS